jgi:hypothetical protein
MYPVIAIRMVVYIISEIDEQLAIQEIREFVQFYSIG